MSVIPFPNKSERSIYSPPKQKMPSSRDKTLQSILNQLAPLAMNDRTGQILPIVKYIESLLGGGK